MQDATIPLSQLNKADFVALLGSIYEHSPWVAERLWQQQCNASAGIWIQGSKWPSPCKLLWIKAVTLKS
ncbi:hypothetical protein P4S72_15505 [Vibrio sp. PP-XX7]